MLRERAIVRVGAGTATLTVSCLAESLSKLSKPASSKSIGLMQSETQPTS